MIVDTSAIMAILLGEADQEIMTDALIAAAVRTMSAGTWIELAAVVTRHPDPNLAEALYDLDRLFLFRIAPVTIEQAELGHAAYREYGRGSGHSARLNFGDCFAYALSKETGEPLLFKGDDFASTDVTPAIA